MSPSFDVFFWTQSTCRIIIYFLKHSTPTNIICWKSIFYNVWRLLLECSVLHLWSLYQSWFKAQEWDQVFFVWKLLCQAWIKIKVLFPVLELNFGTQFQTNFVNSPKDLFAKSVATTVVNAPKIDSSLVNFCKTIFVTLACFFFLQFSFFRLICLVDS